MSTTEIDQIYPTVGAAWQAAVALWVAWVQDDTKTISVSQGTRLSQRYMKMSYVQGGNTFDYNLICADIAGGAVDVPIPYIAQSPGWRSMPQPLFKTFGANTTATNWSNNMLVLRAEVWSAWCGITMPVWTTTDNTTGLTGTRLRQSLTLIVKGLVMLVDAVICTTTEPGISSTVTLMAPLSDGLVAGVQVPTVISMDPAQFAALQTSLEDIAMQNYDLSLNNGATMFSVRGNLRTG